MTKDDAIKAIEGKRVPEADGFPDRDMSQSYNLALDHAIAAVSALPDAGWRDIESAPKDGTCVLVYFSRLTWRDMQGNPCSFGELRDHVERFETGWFQDGQWYESGTGHDMFEGWQTEEQQPTHWMPLPPPPEKA